MGDRLASIGMGRKEGAADTAVSLSARRELGLKITECGLCRGQFVPVSGMMHLDPSSCLATIEMGRNIGAGVVSLLGVGCWVPI